MKSSTSKARIPRLALSVVGALAAAAITIGSMTASATPISLAAVKGQIQVCVVDPSNGSFNIVTSTTGPATNLVTLGTVNIAAGTCATVANDPSTGGTDNFTTTIQLGGRTLDHSDCQDANLPTPQFNTGCSGVTTSATVGTYSNAYHGWVVQYTLVPAAPPSVNKAFSPNVIAPGGTTVLTFTVTNPAGSPAVSNVGFVDTLPVGLKATGLASGSTCANAATAGVTTVSATGSTITVVGLQVPAGASSCTVTVNVTNVTGQFNASCTGNPTAFTNISTNVTVTNVINAVTPSCVVVTPPTPPNDVAVFVIGDVEPHAVGDVVNFWGAQWWKNNEMSGLTTPGNSKASFKGYATGGDIRCGGSWISLPGNSSDPPATIPNKVLVVVTSTVIKSGPNIAGDIVQIVLVNEDGNYGPSPGKRGSGPVDSIVCTK